MKKVDLIYTTYIQSSPQKVWEAITNPEFTRQYWGGMVNVSDWRVGSTWEHQGTGDNQHKVYVVGEIRELDLHKKLVISWREVGSEGEPSEVRFDIRPVAGGAVRLDVTHAELERGSATHVGVSEGWPLVIANMKAFLEGGQPLDMMAILGEGCGKR